MQFKHTNSESDCISIKGVLEMEVSLIIKPPLLT